MIDKSTQPEAQTGSSPATERMRLNLRQLEVFTATARAGSTRAAAAQVARSQSAASSALAELEASLGVQLFDRVGRRLQLNQRGQAFLPQAIALLDHALEVQGSLSDEHHAPLRMAASLTIGEYLLPQRIAAWKLAHPNGTVRLQIANTRDVIAAVVASHADIGFIEGPQTHAELRVRRWLVDELVIVAAPSHPLALQAATRRPSTKQLAQAPWILRELGSGTRQAADTWLLEHLGALRVEFELGSTEAIKRLTASGAGLACLSRHTLADDIAQGRLAELSTRLPTAQRRLAIVTRRDKRLGRASSEFIAFCGA